MKTVFNNNFNFNFGGNKANVAKDIIVKDIVALRKHKDIISD